MLRQKQPCGWCRKTSELTIMVQGGSCHTICPECGSNGPVVSMETLRLAYEEMRQRIAALAADNKRLEGELAEAKREAAESLLAAIRTEHEVRGTLLDELQPIVERMKQRAEQAESERDALRDEVERRVPFDKVEERARLAWYAGRSAGLAREQDGTCEDWESSETYASLERLRAALAPENKPDCEECPFDGAKECGEISCPIENKPQAGCHLYLRPVTGEECADCDLQPKCPDKPGPIQTHVTKLLDAKQKED